MKERNATKPRWDSAEFLSWNSGHLTIHVQERLFQMKQIWAVIEEREQSQVTVRAKENVEQRISRKIQENIVPPIKLVISQLMKKIGQNNCSDIGFEHWMLTGKSLNLIS